MFYQNHFGSRGLQPAHLQVIHKGPHQKDTAAGVPHQVILRDRIRNLFGIETLAFIGDPLAGDKLWHSVANDTSPASTTDTVVVTFTFDFAERVVSWVAQTDMAETPFAFHIHRGPVGFQGPIVVLLTPPPSAMGSSVGSAPASARSCR